MRKIYLAAAAGLALASALPALDLSVHGGYTTFNMHDVNQGNAELIGYHGTGTSAPINSGVVVGADLCGATALPWLKMGLRAETMMSNLAVTQDSSQPDYITEQANLSDLLVGVEASSSQGPGFSLGLGAWAGYGYATLQQDDRDQSLNQSGLFMGSLPVVEGEIKAAYLLGQHLSFSLTGGYRWADAGTLYDDQHQPLYATGPLWWSGYARPVGADYSGITGQGSVSYSF
jgi:hypothetical protein